MTTEVELDQLIDELVDQFSPSSTDPVTFLGAQFDRGLAWVHFPLGQGGLGASPSDQLYVLRRLS